YVIAAGQSQSAHRLITFANAFGKSTGVFDGYFIHSRLGKGIPELGGGGSAPISQSPQADVIPPEVVRIREDLGIPVMNLQAETDQITLGALSSRQDDSEYFRLWEMAGASHADVYVSGTGLSDSGNNLSAATVRLKKTAIPVFNICNEYINSAPQHHFIAKAAMRALNSWIVDGIAPPTFPRLEINATGDGFETDEHGNALGGIRTPYVDVPTAKLSGLNNAARKGDGLCFLFGSTQMLDDATLYSLYPTHDDYVAAVTTSTDDAVNAGALLSEDAKLVIAAAKAANIPPAPVVESEPAKSGAQQ
ncbi:MAG TPA: alpha/beta hydrolase domain-containing protein, partial [Dongiaceae bacterium]|nr:alpha/beta hydrolase domain-containing protein [Dongiaceae bacterium]